MAPVDAGVEPLESARAQVSAFGEHLLDGFVAHVRELRLVRRLLRDRHQSVEICLGNGLDAEEIAVGAEALPGGLAKLSCAFGLGPPDAVDRIAGKAILVEADLSGQWRRLVGRQRAKDEKGEKHIL